MLLDFIFKSHIGIETVEAWSFSNLFHPFLSPADRSQFLIRTQEAGSDNLLRSQLAVKTANTNNEENKDNNIQDKTTKSTSMSLSLTAFIRSYLPDQNLPPSQSRLFLLIFRGHIRPHSHQRITRPYILNS